MRIVQLLLILLVFVRVDAVAGLPVSVGGQPLPSLAPMLERVTPAVVNISTITQVRSEDHPLLRDPFFRWFFDAPRETRERRSHSLGSGVIVDAQRGHVITNHHVIEKADAIRVTLSDGRELDAKLLGTDPETDVAVLSIPAEGLVSVAVADSSQLRVGDFVVAIGNPFGLSKTVTSGIVSALGRSGLGIEGYENFIQTDASINPGNSGGPLVNLRGELVGINTAILAPSGGNVGIGFAIPANMAVAIKRQIVDHGGIRRGVFGVTSQDLTATLARAMALEPTQRGAVVTAVKPGSAAASAGLRAGDLIVRLNGQGIDSARLLETEIALLRIGEAFRLGIIRDGRSRELVARVDDPFADYVDGGKIHAMLAGARLGEVIDDSPLGRNAGIAVGPLSDDAAAARIGLREGDVLFQVNRVRVTRLDELAAAAGARIEQLKLRRGQRLLTLISR